MSWIAPERNGGPELIGYDLRYRQGASESWITHPRNVSGLSTIIGGLDGSTAYEVQVRALNGETPSAWSPSGIGSTNPPVTLAITSDPGNDNTYDTGDTIEVTATFLEAMTVTYERSTLTKDNEENSPATFSKETVTTVTNSPSLKLDIGGSRRLAGYASGSGSAALVFRYTVLDGDRDDDGISIPGK